MKKPPTGGGLESGVSSLFVTLGITSVFVPYKRCGLRLRSVGLEETATTHFDKLVCAKALQLVHTTTPWDVNDTPLHVFVRRAARTDRTVKK